MNQLNLFETETQTGFYGQQVEAKKLARTNDPETSKIAAEKIDVNENEKWVLEWFRKYVAENGDGPVTAWELACQSDGSVCGNPRLPPEGIYDLIHKRLRGLQRKGLIGEFAKRPDRIKGSLMITWVLKKD
jgi:hypothetical protein